MLIYFFTETIKKCVTPLQVRSDKVSENRLIEKHMAMLHTTQCKCCIGGRHAKNYRTESFWREHNLNVMIHVRKVCEKLQSLGHLGMDGNTDL